MMSLSGKKILSFVIVALSCMLSCAPMSAQSHYSSNVAFGVKGGVDLSRVFFTPSVKQGMLLGMNAGVTFRYIEENHFGFIVECNFAQRGWKENFEELPFAYQRTIDYIEVPFLTHIYFGRRGRFFFNAGPQIAFAIGESSKSNFDVDNLENVPNFPSIRNTYQYFKSAKKRVDFGISAGLGGEFSINRRNSLYVEARCYYGLGNVLKSGRTETIRGSNTLSFSASIGYWFRIK